MHKTDIVIIGAGPVGLFAVFEAGMLGMHCHVIDALEHIGGQCIALYPEKPIYDIPAHPKILAAELIAKLEEQARPFDPHYHLNQQVIGLTQLTNEEGKQIFKVTTSTGIEILAKIVIIAAGCGAFGPNKPPLKDIEQYEGNSVFYFVANREMFSGKEVVIAGGGDSALDWTISLAEIAKKIYLVHRRDKFRGTPDSIKKVEELAEKGIVEMVIGYQLSGLIGKNGILEAVEVVDLDHKTRILSAKYLLPFFGLAQDLGPINDWQLQVKSHHITVDSVHYQTNTANIYAIGDVATYPGKLKLILSGFAEAASVMHHAYSTVFDGKALHFEYSTNKGINQI